MRKRRVPDHRHSHATEKTADTMTRYCAAFTSTP
jgi:hypothetical protein